MEDGFLLSLHESSAWKTRRGVESFELRPPEKSRVRTDSSAVDPTIWFELANHIYQDQKKDKVERRFQGFVVMHGLDTLTYTASALSFMLHDLNAPVILVGSQRPIGFTRTDAVQNIAGDYHRGRRRMVPRRTPTRRAETLLEGPCS